MNDHLNKILIINPLFHQHIKEFIYGTNDFIKWKQNIKYSNVFINNIFNNNRSNHYHYHKTPCWYCNKSSHSVFHCIKYHRDLDNHYYKWFHLNN